MSVHYTQETAISTVLSYATKYKITVVKVSRMSNYNCFTAIFEAYKDDYQKFDNELRKVGIVMQEDISLMDKSNNRPRYRYDNTVFYND